MELKFNLIVVHMYAIFVVVAAALFWIVCVCMRECRFTCKTVEGYKKCDALNQHLVYRKLNGGPQFNFFFRVSFSQASVAFFLHIFIWFVLAYVRCSRYTHLSHQNYRWSQYILMHLESEDELIPSNCVVMGRHLVILFIFSFAWAWQMIVCAI